MANPFDQFDTQASSNPFDQFDAATQPQDNLRTPENIQRFSNINGTPAQGNVVDRLKNAVYAPPEQREAMPSLGELLSSTPGAMASAVGNAASQFGSNLLKPQAYAGPVPMQSALDLANLVFSPISGAATNLLGRPVESATGIRKDLTGTLATAVLPLGMMGKAGKLAEEAKLKPTTEPLMAAEPAAASPLSADAIYSDKVARLKDQGVVPTLGQRLGGQARRQEESAKSDPLVGGAVRKQEQIATDSFNTALYNKVLEPIGQKYEGKAVGRDAVKVVGDKVSAEYESLKPKMSLVPDDELINGLSDLRKNVGELPPAQQSQFEAILNNRVLHRVGTNGMDGGTFKQVESEISKLARDYKGSPDPAQRGLGAAIEDINGLLRDNLERSSAPEIRTELQKVNQSWALLTRLEDAAQARKGSGGVVTPGDLLGSIRKMDRTVRHRSFARGDAALQSFAEDAMDVLGNKLPDSGTPERLAFNHHGLLMYALGKATNPLAGGAMNVAKGIAGREPGPPLNLPRPRYPALPLLLQAPNQSQQ